jgi:hypothetical protein
MTTMKSLVILKKIRVKETTEVLNNNTKQLKSITINKEWISAARTDRNKVVPTLVISIFYIIGRGRRRKYHF